ncbi:MAG: hypothetical protein U0166_23620 [Acidobacteriota bacterium]
MKHSCTTGTRRVSRRLLPIAVLGSTWAVAWAAIFSALVLVVGYLDPGAIGPGEGPADVRRVGVVVGAVSGMAFGCVLTLAEAGRSMAFVTRPRAALWGIAGSALFPLATGRADQVLVLCPIGALLAVASVAVARRGSGVGAAPGSAMAGARGSAKAA